MIYIHNAKLAGGRITAGTGVADADGPVSIQIELGADGYSLAPVPVHVAQDLITLPDFSMVERADAPVRDTAAVKLAGTTDDEADNDESAETAEPADTEPVKTPETQKPAEPAEPQKRRYTRRAGR